MGRWAYAIKLLIDEVPFDNVVTLSKTPENQLLKWANDYADNMEVLCNIRYKNDVLLCLWPFFYGGGYV